MESEVHQHTFGDYLRRCRIERGLAIETVAQRTKITLQCLQALEQSAHRHLPPRAYVKSFIRAYAEAVGADARTGMELYLDDLEREAAARRLLLKRQAQLQTLRRTLIAVGLITSLLLLVRYTDILPDPATTPAPATPGEAVATPLASVETADTEAVPALADPAETLKLQVIAVEQTWLKVMVDGQSARSYDLKPADRLELEGTTSFNLMIGNATGLKVLLNDRPVKIHGSSGQVVSLKIP